MGRRLLAYYAHSIDTYDTPVEGEDIRFIEEQLGYDVWNPNNQEDKDAYVNCGMEHFRRRAQGCDVLVLRAFPDGYIGAGKAKEALAMWEVGKTVLELPTRLEDIEKAKKLGVLVVELLPGDIKDRVLDVEETRRYLKGYRRTPDNLEVTS